MEFPVNIPLKMQQELQQLYATPLRAYHNMTHIQEMLEQFLLVQENVGWKAPKEVYLALLYHDAIYDFSAKDNEAKSAQCAKKSIVQFLPNEGVNISQVCRLIELTAQHGSLKKSDLSVDEQLFLDMDMSIIAKDWTRFVEYESQIEIEYSHVYPRWMYRIGRRKFLNKILEQPRIFFSDWYFEHFEDIARQNVAKIL